MVDQDQDGGRAILQEIFSSRLRAAVLGQMLPRPHLRFSLTDLSRILDLPISSLQHECYKLERLGLIESRRAGNTRRYRVVTESGFYPPLARLVTAAIGVERTLKASLETVTGLDTAFLAEATGGAAGAPARLVLIGDIPLEEIDAIQERATVAAGGVHHAIETVFYRQDDWRDRIAQRSAYVLSLLNGPRLDLVGSPVAHA
jgi:DNA-binding transcriptional ArsR family regulator